MQSYFTFTITKTNTSAYVVTRRKRHCYWQSACPTGPKNPNYYIWKKLYNTLEDPVTTSSAKVPAEQMLAAFLSQPVLSAAGDTLLSTPEDKSSKRSGCLDPEVDGDPKKACRNHRSV